MEEMLENRRNKRIQRNLPKAQTSTNSEEEKFEKKLTREDGEKVCRVYKGTYVL